jgi:MFS family permease
MTTHEMTTERELAVATKEHHPTKWYLEMSPAAKAAFWACIIGWMMDAMDVQMFTFANTGIMKAFHVERPDVAFIQTVTLLTSAVGGWLAGALSDRIGRVPALQITIVWFAVFTGLSGMAWNYNSLLVLRGLMGFGFGGEWAAAAVLIGEVIDPAHRGKAVGTMQSGWAIGWGVAAGVATLLLSIFPEETAWRWMFVAGLAPAVPAFLIRWFVHEPPVFAETQKKLEAEGKTANFLAIFAPKMLPTTTLACMLSVGTQGGYYAITFFLPMFLREERNLGVPTTGGYLGVIIVGSFVGYLVSAYLNDRIGRRANFILFAVFSIAIVIAYTLIPVNNTVIFALGFPLGFLASGIFSGMGPILTELFPTELRGSGQGFAYNFGRCVAALNLWFLGLLSASLGLGLSIGIFALTAYGIVVIVALLLPNTTGRSL